MAGGWASLPAATSGPICLTVQAVRRGLTDWLTDLHLYSLLRLI